MVAAAVAAAATMVEISAGQAYGDAPWCAVIEIGDGDVYWDCQYRSIEECRPNVIAGNRGFCNVNPYGGRPAPAPPARRHKSRSHSHR